MVGMLRVVMLNVVVLNVVASFEQEKKKTAALLRGRFDEQKMPLGVTKLVTNR